eukprot:TRINITY_DN11502_c0_g1_i1.p1 TRINITY_DN11502_c0_g1~~TRINITY_DN11502_c0_g1_i1.p1  ORF type:complete len:332 (+),score=114.16 TRINITY_DN11502_c0_g1_i1:102-998(+)
MSEAAEKPKQSMLNAFLSGGFGGMCLVLAGHPLDTIKVRVQTQTQYKGTIDCFRRTVAEEGAMALYKGMGAPLAGVTPMYALCFLGYGYGKRMFCDADAFEKLKLQQIALAGATSAFFTTPILAPGERLKCVLQVQKDKSKFKGPVDLGKHVWKEAGGGVAGLQAINKGFCATFTRDAVASAFYFSSYEVLKRKLTPEGAADPGPLRTLFCGGMAGIFNWAFAIPFDTMKSKIQITPEQYPRGMRSVASEMIAQDGMGAIFSMYRGFSAVMLRAFPANAACFLGVETAVKGLNAIGLH